MHWFDNGQFPLYLAPMAGFTDVAFRQLCKENGADVMVTEFVLADSLVRGARKAWDMVDFTPEQRPMGVQIFGSSPEVMGEAARMIVDRLGPDFIDLNFGCPADRITDMNAGSSMLKDPPLLGAVAREVVRAVPREVPVTGKIRIGWDDESIVAMDVSRRLEDAGAQAVAIHGRTKMQGYSGDANWDVIAEVAEALTVPVVGNGNVRTSGDVIRLRRNTKVAGLMIGRAALGYPWIFKEIKQVIATGIVPEPPGLEERWATVLSFCGHLIERSPEPPPVKLGKFRSKLVKLVKGMPGCRQLRNAFSKIETYEDLVALSERHMEEFREAEYRLVAFGGE